MLPIRQTAVLGAGVMGAAIAAHLANAGLKVLLLDRVPDKLTDTETAQGVSADSADFRNRLAVDGLEHAIAAKAFYDKADARLVKVGNFDDDMEKIADCDWVIEVVVEDLAIKKQLLTERVVPHLSPGTILATNTSGLSVNKLAEVLTAEQRRNFLVTHFFNPPRYQHLLEIVPCRETAAEIVAGMADFARQRLGKGIVFGKDTPNFVANRIGVYTMLNAIRHMQDLGLSVEEVDAVSGPVTARPKSAIFRTFDLVGLDTMVHVARNSYDLLTDDESRESFRTPELLKEMVEKGLLGQKAKQGFYRKTKEGILHFNYNSGDYVEAAKPEFDSVLAAKKAGTPGEKVKTVIRCDDKAAEFTWRNLRDTLIYTVNRVPGIADDIVNVDNAVKWGFNWELGPFEMLDAIGIDSFIDRARADGIEVPETLHGVPAFYKVDEGREFAWNLVTRQYDEIMRPGGEVSLTRMRRRGSVLESNDDASIHDLGDGVVGLEFHSKMNTIGFGTITMIERAVDRAEQTGVGLLIANQGKVFSAGANIGLFLDAIRAQRFDRMDELLRRFQGAMMRLKYAPVPVVVAPFNLAIGGAAEIVLHADAVNFHAETYMGLVEVGVGVLPAGGGTKEMALRAIRLATRYKTDVGPFIGKHFQNIVMAKVSGSAAELEAMGYSRSGDSITMNLDRLIADARQKLLALSLTYRPSLPETEVRAPGRGIGAMLKNRLFNMQAGGYITDYERSLGDAIAEVITGGDVPDGTLIDEQYLLELERDAFLRFCSQQKTAERIEHMLKTGKPLRN